LEKTVNWHYKTYISSCVSFNFELPFPVFYLLTCFEDKFVDECVFCSYRSSWVAFFKIELQFAPSVGRKWKHSTVSFSLRLPHTRLLLADRDSQLPPRQCLWWLFVTLVLVIGSDCALAVAVTRLTSGFLKAVFGVII